MEQTLRENLSKQRQSMYSPKAVNLERFMGSRSDTEIQRRYGK